jgi:hypothetical protein
VPSPGGHRAPTMIPPGLSIAPLRRSQCCSTCIFSGAIGLIVSVWRPRSAAPPHWPARGSWRRQLSGPAAAVDSCGRQGRTPGAVGSAASTALTLVPWVRGSGFANSATRSRRGQRDGRFLVSWDDNWVEYCNIAGLPIDPAQLGDGARARPDYPRPTVSSTGFSSFLYSASAESPSHTAAAS